MTGIGAYMLLLKDVGKFNALLIIVEKGCPIKEFAVLRQKFAILWLVNT